MVSWSSLNALFVEGAIKGITSLDVVIGVAVFQLHRRQLTGVLTIDNASPRRIGCPVVDAVPFQLYMKKYNTQSYYNVLVSLATILSITYFNMEETRAEVEKHLVLRALIVLSMANLLSGLMLSVLFMDTLTHVSSSCYVTLAWITGATAISTSCVSMPLILATPFTSTASGIAAFIMYRVASAVISSFDMEHAAHRTTDDAEQYIAMAVTAYVAVVIVQTAMTARAFLRIKTSTIIPSEDEAALVTTS